MKLSIVLSTHAAQFDAVTFKGDLEQNIAKIASFGYDGVELAIRDPSLVNQEELISTASRHAMPLPAIGTGQAWGDDHLSFTDPDAKIRRQAVDRIAAHVPLAAQANAIIIIGLVRGIIQPGVSETQANDWMFSCFKACVALASAQGVRIAFEPLNRYETPLLNTAREGLDFIDRVAADNLGLLLDTFHMNIEEPSIEQSIKNCGERIFHFHVADSNRHHPGAGHLDFRTILETLLSRGYTGYISGEFMPIPEADTSAQRAIEFLRNLGL